MDATDLDDPMQTCPYDGSHRILKSRMQFHLVRCRKNHPANKDQLSTCPFDALHVVNSIEYEYHVANCPKSGNVYNFMFSSEGQRSVGSVSLELSNSVYVPPSAENWDEDPPAPTYDPLQQAKNRYVLLSEIGLSKAKKRQFKNSERLRIQALEESGICPDDLPEPVKEDPDKPLRKPHNLPQVLTLLSNKGKEHLSDPEVRLRPPRSKSVALSVCSNIDYEDEILDTNKHTNFTKRFEYPEILGSNKTSYSTKHSECSDNFDASKSSNLTKRSDCSEIFNAIKPSYSTNRSEYLENLDVSKSSSLTKRCDRSEILDTNNFSYSTKRSEYLEMFETCKTLKSTKRSECSEILDASKSSDSTKPSEYPVSINKALSNTPDMALHSSAVFNSILKEASKKVNQAANGLMKQTAKQNNTALDAGVVVLNSEEVVSIDPRFLLSDLATSNSSSSSSSSTTDDSDDFFKNYTDLAVTQIEIPLSNPVVIQCEIQPVINSEVEAKSSNTPHTEIFMGHSTDAIKEVISRLATVSTLEKSLEEEKAKLKQQVDEYYATCGPIRLRTNKNNKTTNPRCAANFSKANEDKTSWSK